MIIGITTTYWVCSGFCLFKPSFSFLITLRANIGFLPARGCKAASLELFRFKPAFFASASITSRIWRSLGNSNSTSSISRKMSRPGLAAAAWFKNGAFWVTKQDKSSHCSDNGLQYKNIKAQPNLSGTLKSFKPQQFQPVGMFLSHHQLCWTLADSFRTATPHKSPVVQKEA